MKFKFQLEWLVMTCPNYMTGSLTVRNNKYVITDTSYLAGTHNHKLTWRILKLYLYDTYLYVMLVLLVVFLS